jgi:hypothetical protein
MRVRKQWSEEARKQGSKEAMVLWIREQGNKGA